MIENDSFVLSPSVLPQSNAATAISVNLTQKCNQRRKRIPNRPSNTVNYLSLMKNCIGKDLSRIAMPVDFNEPLSALQRTTEELEYAHVLLNRAANVADDSSLRLALVAAFAISGYSTSSLRTTKPFNPLLGETFECDRRTDLGWCSLAEQVSHHPPRCALFAEGRKWTLSQCYTITTKVKGRSLCVLPIGSTYLRFLDNDDFFVYDKVCTSTTIANIVSGKLQTENYGDLTIRNARNNDCCALKFHENYSGLFSSESVLKKVTGIVRDSNNVERYKIDAVWDSFVRVTKLETVSKASHAVSNEQGEIVWRAHELLKNAQKMHNFTQFAIELNEPEAGVAPTDSRLRPDQRLMEQGDWGAANLIKQKLEEAQRRRRKAAEGNEALVQRPFWFTEKERDEMLDKNDIYTFNGEYWRRKEEYNWDCCPNIFHF